MENMEKSEHKYCETVYDNHGDVVREADIIVPDYYPDVLKIVRADAIPVITSVEPSKDKVTLSGNIMMVVLYMPEEGNTPQALRQTFDFESVMPATGVAENSMLFTNIMLNYINCKMLNSRKLSLKVGADIHVKAENCGMLSVLTPISDIETQVENMHICNITGRSDKSIKIEEDIEVPAANPAIANHLYSYADAKPVEYKAINNKIIAKGVINVHTLYTADGSGDIQYLDSEIPFSHIFDIDGVDDSSMCIVDMSVNALKTEIYENDGGENRVIACECDVRCCGTAYNNDEFEYCTDAFSTGYDYKCDKKKYHICSSMDFVNLAGNVREVVDFSREISRVFTSSGTVTVLNADIDDGKLNVSGNLNISMLALMADGDLDSLESSVPFTITTAAGNAPRGSVIDSKLALDSFSFVISGATAVEIRASIGGVAIVKRMDKIEAVSDMSVDEEKPKKRAGDYIVLYYPSKNESIWDIAKRYNVKVSSIKDLNSFEGDVCDKNMLLIPKK